MAQTIYGCVDYPTGVVTFSDVACVGTVHAGCFNYATGQVAVTIDGGECDDTYYACVTYSTGKFQITIPEDCCNCTYCSIAGSAVSVRLTGLTQCTRGCEEHVGAMFECSSNIPSSVLLPRVSDCRYEKTQGTVIYTGRNDTEGGCDQWKLQYDVEWVATVRTDIHGDHIFTGADLVCNAVETDGGCSGWPSYNLFAVEISGGDLSSCKAGSVSTDSCVVMPYSYGPYECISTLKMTISGNPPYNGTYACMACVDGTVTVS